MGAGGEGLRRITEASNGRRTYVSVAWSPTSHRLALTSFVGSNDARQEISLQSCNPDGGGCSTILSDKKLVADGGDTHVVWSSDNRIFYEWRDPDGRHQNVWSIPVDPDSGKVTGPAAQVTSQAGFSASALSLSLDGKKLAFLEYRVAHTIRLLDLRQSAIKLEAAQEIQGDTWDKYLGNWTPDGTAVVFESNPQQRWGIFKYDLRTRQTTPLVVGPDNYIDPVVSPDGQWLLFARRSADRSVPRQLMRMPMNGGAASAVLSGDFSCKCAARANGRGRDAHH
jgi:WD40-like Beta Propeller Repeat